MLFVKNKNPLVSLFIAVCIMGILYTSLSMMTSFQTTEEELQPVFERGNIFLPVEGVAPFRDKYNVNKNIEVYKDAIDKNRKVLEGAIRKEYMGYASLNAKWSAAFMAPIQYSGVLMPVKAIEIIDVSDEWKFDWAVVKVKLEAGEILVHLVDHPEEIIKGEVYFLDLFYLGKVKGKNGSQHHGIAHRLYLLPDKGVLPKERSDEAAFEKIVDEYSLPFETRRISSDAFQHFLSKVQTEDHRKIEPLKGVGYAQLMDSPNRYRGKVVEVTGSLIHYVKRRLSGAHIKPGMEFYYECYLLDSDRLEYIVRSFDIPQDVKPRDIFHAKGYFMQRTNFHNRMNKVTWAPLIIAMDLEVRTEKPFGISSAERIALILILSVLILIFIVLVFLKKKKTTRSRGPLLKVKKPKTK